MHGKDACMYSKPGRCEMASVGLHPNRGSAVSLRRWKQSGARTHEQLLLTAKYTIRFLFKNEKQNRLLLKTAT